jgi:nucleotide sugar dehydrogenase
MNICVVGGGRMGLPLACVFAKQGAQVTVVDIDAALVRALNGGTCPYDEPGLEPLIAALHRSGNLSATTDTAAAAAQADAIVVIVPAHLTREREIDFSVLQAASAEIGKGLQRGALVVYETTVSVGGTRRHLIPLLEQHSGLRAGDDFLVGYSPERVKANLVLERLETTPKVIGGLDEASRQRTAALYSRYLGAPIDEVGTLEAAEMTKLLGMIYRDVNIALANELAAFCEVASIDFERVRAAANRDGEASVLLPGIGVGGHCTPVYPYFLTRESRRLGLTQRISEAAREINDLQPGRQVERLARAWQALEGRRVALLGLGFRPDVKVATLSPAYSLRDELVRHGAIVSVCDPLYTDDELRQAGFVPGPADGAEAVILNTAHSAFVKPDFAAWKRRGVCVLLDGRNFWDAGAATSAGLIYLGIGRAPSSRATSST